MAEMGVSLALRSTRHGYLQELYVFQGEREKGRELIQEEIPIRDSLRDRLYSDLGSKLMFWVALPRILLGDWMEAKRMTKHSVKFRIGRFLSINREKNI